MGLVIQMVLAPINKILINHLIYFILYTILDGFREVLPKYLMEKKYVEPLILIFYEGVIWLIINFGFLFFGIPSFVINSKDEFIIDIISVQKILENSKNLIIQSCLLFIMVCGVTMIIQFFHRVSEVYTTFYFSPIHRLLPNNFQNDIIVLIILFDLNVKLIVSELILLVFQIIGLLIFLELIIIDLCNLYLSWYMIYYITYIIEVVKNRILLLNLLRLLLKESEYHYSWTHNTRSMRMNINVFQK